MVRNLPIFEWTFGLDYHGFPFENEYNVASVPKDLITCVKERDLRFASSKDVIQHVYDLLQHNNVSSISEWRRSVVGVTPFARAISYAVVSKGIWRGTLGSICYSPEDLTAKP
ncbi:hypothetical protein WG66_013322 [Moniliophthora roreri]|nr:hypothetical protein WG66_013322 [Moniliophthora roreri]